MTTPDEAIATAMLLGGEFRRCTGEEHRNAHGWYCYEPSGIGSFAPNYRGSETKSAAAEVFLGMLGYWIDHDGEIRDCNLSP